MAELKDLYQSADWKKEKHAPAIEAPDAVSKGGEVTVSVSVGREIAHPNTTAHHIRWIEVFFQPEGGKFPFQVGRFDFSAHGESPEGPDTSSIYTAPRARCTFKTDKPGTIMASSYCNIHGLWGSSKPLAVS
ncbi:MAG TPA: class II SORL domain-containing protein [Spirochaetia bacterium]|nr:class II SORL domain-containing protein [Spirochaetia bacterium]